MQAGVLAGAKSGEHGKPPSGQEVLLAIPEGCDRSAPMLSLKTALRCSIWREPRIDPSGAIRAIEASTVRVALRVMLLGEW